ncbi:MAG: hypothetical protein A2622_12100 [Bdellovibrionales bacterium RIFCSPHIGHO2_01_FULL_40_29]|nr:MAG: hypothetical protein A2622_12100 [Bdellovibrionales bacterium RIFCSPHIGHO2_01_FULL_40_29]
MYQNKMNRPSDKMISFCMFVVLCAVSFSCAKKPSGVRAVKKTESVNMSPAISNQSEQQAQAQNIMYKLSTVSTPTITSSGHTVDSDLQTPDLDYLPITTSHENGNLYSEGSYTDAKRGARVLIQAECFGSDCYKYLLLVTVVKNNLALYQTAALSFKDDCRFYTISMAQGVGNFFQSIDELDSYTQSKNYLPKNDCLSEE